MVSRTVEFRACTVTINDGWIETRFREDGSVAHFHPPLEAEDFKAAARFAGYGDDTWRHAVEHDLTHGFLADFMRWPYSWSVWSAAHGKASPKREWSRRVADEEHLVVSLQRYINTGIMDDYHVLLGQFGVELPQIALRLMLVLRPWMALKAAA